MEKNNNSNQETTIVNNQKFSKSLIIATIILIVSLTGLMIVGFFVFQSLNQKKVSEDYNVNYKTDENQSWPKDIPSIVPEFRGGKIFMSAKGDGNTSTLTIREVSISELEAYINNLTAADWKVEDATKSAKSPQEDLKAYTAIKDTYFIMITLTPSKGLMSFSVTKNAALKK